MIRKATAILALVIGFAAPVWADSIHIGDTTNVTNKGGQGGQGGAGGTGVGVGIGKGGAGGSASAAAGASANSTNINVNTQGQHQGQQQGQGQYQGQGQGQSYQGEQTTSVNFEGTRFDRYAPPVMAPGLTSAGTGVCLGSVSIGLSGPMAGASFGITKVDKGCEQRSAAALLYQMGYKDAAVRLLMKNDDVREALGTDAPRTAKAASKAPAPVEPVTVPSAAIFTEPVVSSAPAIIQAN